MRRTQRAIKQVLTERYYSWRDAEAIAKDDPEINLSGNGQVYVPRDFEEEDVDLEEELKPELEARAEPVDRAVPPPPVATPEKAAPSP